MFYQQILSSAFWSSIRYSFVRVKSSSPPWVLSGPDRPISTIRLPCLRTAYILNHMLRQFFLLTTLIVYDVK